MKIITFGEVLWDVFQEKREIGGAPFNFAAHARKQGASVDMVTSVGKDVLAKETMAEIEKQGIGMGFISTSELKTGVCQVTLDKEGLPTYDLVMPVAYDSIKLRKDQLERITQTGYDCLYYGTLALRYPTSFDTLKDLLALNCFGNILCDVNLRQNYYTEKILCYTIENATIVKISREELPQVSQCLKCGNNINYDEFCRGLFKRFIRLHTVILTLDKQGAMIVERNGETAYSMLPINKVVSTVGAGDSFTATFIVSRFMGYNLKMSLDRAVKVSDFVVTQTEAIPDYDPEELFI